MFDGVIGGDRIGKTNADQPTGAVVGPFSPKIAITGRVAAGGPIGIEGINDGPVFAHRQMHMGEGGLSRLPDKADGVAQSDLLPLGNADRALFEVAVLGFPTVPVVKHDAVATFLTVDIGSVFAGIAAVSHAVAHTGDTACGAGKDGDVVGDTGPAGQCEIRAFVPVIA